MKTLFYNARLVDSEIDTNGALLIDDDVIVSVYTGNFSTEQKAKVLQKDIADELAFIDCEGKTLMPSFIDMHVHFRYPGQTEKEDLESGLNAAVAGGFGTLVLMPNTKPVVSSSELAHSIEEEAESYGKASIIQTVSITKNFSGTDTSHLDNLDRIPIVTEDGFDVPTANVMLEAMEKCASSGIIVNCHCEDMTLTPLAKKCRNAALSLIEKYDETREDAKIVAAQIDAYLEEANMILSLSEDIATLRNIEIAYATNCPVHISHVSTKNSIEAIRRAKQNGMNITCEITPHHFSLDCDKPNMLRYLVNPPIRTKKDRAALLKALTDGTCDVISTDHAPHTLADKVAGAPGFPGLETSFAVAHTELVQTGFLPLTKLSELMSAKPAQILGLDNFSANDLTPPRGKLRKHFLANLVLVDLHETWIVDSTKFKTKGKVCPFEGKQLFGKVCSTYYMGKKVY
ncbi:MAG: dihydroorotase [Treponema sp.]|nr:dihydroorotase [Treponema sp.]